MRKMVSCIDIHVRKNNVGRKVPFEEKKGGC